jgi:type II secretory pathway pseudopilin PulG
MTDWRLVALIVTLVLTHGAAAWMGRSIGKSALDRAMIEQQNQIIELEQQARETEQRLTAEKHQAEVKYAQSKREVARIATDNLSELEQLRHSLASRNQSSGKDTATSAGAYGTTERELFRACAETLASMAAEADQVSVKLSGLQDYVSAVCAKQ